MSNPTTYTKPLTGEQAVKLKALLAERGWKFEVKPYCLFAASKPGVNVAVYEKGPKIVVQGKETGEFVSYLLEPEILGEAELGYEEVLQPEFYEAHIGVDESGKGDFFGPLVVAGVFLEGEGARRLREEGVMDSKRISSEGRIEALAKVIRSAPGVRHEVIVMQPKRYNELYEKFGNLNRLLAWGHAKVIETLLERVPECRRAVSDQFANPAVLQRALQARGRGIELVQRTKAESDPAVAAASILAREGFVRWLASAGGKWGILLGKGVSGGVKAAASQFIAEHGREALGEVAKLHFKTAQEV
jgi:ribonuclease HIII